MASDDVFTVRGNSHVTQHFQRTKKHGQRGPACRNSLQVVFFEIRRRFFDEPLHQRIVMLNRRLLTLNENVIKKDANLYRKKIIKSLA